MKNILSKIILIFLMSICMFACTKIEFATIENKTSISDIPSSMHMKVGDTLSVEKLNILNLDYFIYKGSFQEQFRILDRDTSLSIKFVNYQGGTKKSQLVVDKNYDMYSSAANHINIDGDLTASQDISSVMGLHYNSTDNKYQATINLFSYELTIDLFNNYSAPVAGHQQQYESYGPSTDSYSPPYFKLTMYTSGGFGSTYVSYYDPASFIRFSQDATGKNRIDMCHILLENTSTYDHISIDLNYQDL